MSGLIMQSWGAGGIEWEMRAPVGEGYTNRYELLVSSMDTHLYRDGQPSTRINARRAVMATGDPPGGRRVEPMPGVALSTGDMFLDGDVVVVSTDGSRIRTDWARYSAGDGIIRSSAPVEIERPDSITHGFGLEATADLSSIKVFDQTLVIPGKEKAP